jgi:predicted transcriptional regulator
MAETTVTVRVDPELTTAFLRAAEGLNRTGEEILCAIMQDFIATRSADTDHNRWFRQQVPIGIGEADTGDVVSGEEVEAEFASLRMKAIERTPEAA